jgi:L-ascorbate metabolism protein UlaG (beta-lactamase superfamily)
MTTHIRFFGVAAYEIVTSQGQHILIDPFLDDNPGSPIKSEELEQVDLVLVSHAAFDHLGDADGHSSECPMARTPPASRWALWYTLTRVCDSITTAIRPCSAIYD